MRKHLGKFRLLGLALLLFTGIAAATVEPMLMELPLPPVPAHALPAPADPHVILTWIASTSAASCVSPGCTFGYNVFRGTASGGESTTPLNGTTPLTALTYSDSITLTSSLQSYYYVVQAVETASGISASSANSNEVSATFPGVPAAPVVSVTTTAN